MGVVIEGLDQGKVPVRRGELDGMALVERVEVDEDVVLGPVAAERPGSFLHGTFADMRGGEFFGRLHLGRLVVKGLIGSVAGRGAFVV